MTKHEGHPQYRELGAYTAPAAPVQGEEQTHFKEFVDYIIGDDDSELGKTKAELNYALHCLEREIAICTSAQQRIDELERALRLIAECTCDQLPPYRGIGPEQMSEIARKALIEPFPGNSA